MTDSPVQTTGVPQRIRKPAPESVQTQDSRATHCKDPGTSISQSGWAVFDLGEGRTADLPEGVFAI